MDGAQLESYVDSWPEELALVVAIAAKGATSPVRPAILPILAAAAYSRSALPHVRHAVSTLHVLTGRFSSDSLKVGAQEDATFDDDSPAEAATDAQSSSDRLAALRRETADEATTWLSRVCAHIQVRLDQLPDALDPDTSIPLPVPAPQGKDPDQTAAAAERAKREWDAAWELVLVSLGLLGTSAPTAAEAAAATAAAPPAEGSGEADRGRGSEQKRASSRDGEKQNLASKLGSKVGSLFSATPPPASTGVSRAASDPPGPRDTTATVNSSTSSDVTPPPLNYTALSRSLVVRTLAVLWIPESVLSDIEHTIAQFLFFQLQERDHAAAGGAEAQVEAAREAQVGWDSAAKESRDRAAKKGNALKWAATGAGFVLGGVAIGLTGGFAAPAIAAGLGTFGIATFSGAGGAVLIGTLLGLGGGGLAGYRTHRRMKGLDDVRFEPIQDADAHELPQIPSLTATIVASGFLLDPEDSVEPWRSYVRSSRADAYALKADPKTFLEAGRSLDKYVQTRLLTMGGVEVVKRTALAAIYAGVALPLTLVQTATTAFDSDFTRCRDKAHKAGILLAEILQREVHGKRPVVLIGYGPGASLILSCLEHLHSLGLGSVVYRAVLISLPSSPSRTQWARARSVVTHELVNAWSANDWVLAIAARVYTLSPYIAGIRPVRDVPVDVVNVDVSDLVTKGHLELRQQLPAILQRVFTDPTARTQSDPRPEVVEQRREQTRDAAGGSEDSLTDHLAEEVKTLDVNPRTGT
ncbi:hypothetical protein JCM3774_002150 [Rhodotorula dairenensis]